MKYLLSISIGPVQDFIATARRSRDLWYGSWLLSELSKAAAGTIGKDNLIFPFAESDDELKTNSPFNAVNKILAFSDNPGATAQAVLTNVRSRLGEISNSAFDGILKKDIGRYFLGEVAGKQVGDLVEFFWAAYPLENDGAYQRAREKVEILLSARKSTRNFKSSADWASNAPKSALDGQRESVIHDDAFDKLTAKELRHIYGVRAGERLCGVGLLKRNGNRGHEDSFFSTSHVAALPLIERLKPEQRDRLDTYINDLCAALHLDKESSDLGRVPYKEPYDPHPVFSRTVKGHRIGYDGHLLFQERLGDLVENENEKESAKADLEKARNALRYFLKDAFAGETPSPYYALLLADGDNMGKVIDNIARIQIENLEDIEKHRKLSQNLKAFAKSASQIVIGSHKGSLVYAGGDDVLAFLPLHTVLQCARDLADAFKAQLARFKFTEKEGGIEYQPTLSVGVVIAHHLEPLQDALALVRKAEKVAKAVDGKNALAIILSKRGGSDTTVKGSWKGDATRRSFDSRLMHFAQLHLTGDFPDGAAYELQDLHLRLSCSPQEVEYGSLKDAMRGEAVRILGRKQIKDEGILSALTHDVQNETSIDDLANQLIVARQFAKAFEQAGKTSKDLNAYFSKTREEGQV